MATVPTLSDESTGLETIRRANWIAIVVATLLMMFSYFIYGAAFIDEDGEQTGIDLRFAFIGLAIAPFVFIALGFLSRNPLAPKRVLQAMGLLLVVGLAIGFVDPLLGASIAFAVGGALVLNRPSIPRVVYWRTAAVVFTAMYVLVLMIVVPPAGVFTGGLLPLMMIGFADEYAAWSAARQP